MSRASVLARGRVAAEAGMVDTCLIERSTDSSTDGSGNVTFTYTTVYSGPCRLQELTGLSRETHPSPDQLVLARNRTLQLPVAGSEGVKVGDKVTITTCVNDADMTGARMVVRELSGKTDATMRRLGVDQLTG